MQTKVCSQIMLALCVVSIALFIVACGPGSPDLTGTLECPSEATAGQELGSSLTATVSNDGAFDAGEFNVDLVISSDTTIPVQPAPYSPNYAEDVLLKGGREFVSGLPPNGTQPVTLNGTNQIPVDTPAGNYYLGMVIDPTGAVGEFDESNNIALCAITINACPATADITTAEIIEASGGTVGFARLRLRWSFGPGELPERLLITVFRFQAGAWDNIMPGAEPFELPDPTVTESDVTIFRLFSGNYRLVYNASYSCDREGEFTFEQLLE